MNPPHNSLQAPVSYPTSSLTWNDMVPYLLKSGPGIINLSSGNPVILEEVVQALEMYYRQIVASPSLRHIVYQYNQPQGHPGLRQILASVYAREYNFPLTAENVMITPGSQATFFYLSELAGKSGRSIHFPCGPEYPGYRTHDPSLYRMAAPLIHMGGAGRFRYKLNLEAIPDDFLFMVVSAPSNPTGNIPTREEFQSLQDICDRRQAYLFIDGAYARPVPGIQFSSLDLPWTRNTILSTSFSKAGLAGERLGVVFAAPEVINDLLTIQTKFSILSPRLVQFVVAEMLAANVLQNLSANVILPCYQERYRTACQALQSCLPDFVPYSIYDSGGGPFLWLWLDELPQSSSSLFFQLLEKNLIVMPSGVFYLPELQQWPHAQQCFRIGLIEEPATIAEAMAIFSETVSAAYRR